MTEIEQNIYKKILPVFSGRKMIEAEHLAMHLTRSEINTALNEGMISIYTTTPSNYVNSLLDDTIPIKLKAYLHRGRYKYYILNQVVHLYDRTDLLPNCKFNILSGPPVSANFECDGYCVQKFGGFNTMQDCFMINRFGVWDLFNRQGGIELTIDHYLKYVFNRTVDRRKVEQLSDLNEYEIESTKLHFAFNYVSESLSAFYNTYITQAETHAIIEVLYWRGIFTRRTTAIAEVNLPVTYYRFNPNHSRVVELWKEIN